MEFPEWIIKRVKSLLPEDKELCKALEDGDGQKALMILCKMFHSAIEHAEKLVASNQMRGALGKKIMERAKTLDYLITRIEFYNKKE